ncbi:MAG: hypothetical protein ACJ8C4_20050 [Gemmataceae bacterium]
MARSGGKWVELAVAAGLGLGLAAVLVFWPQQHKSPLGSGQTLLGKAADSFSDEQTGLRFKPPAGWSMQGRTLASPDQTLSPRLVVKFKRLAPNVAVAWFRVFVHETPADQSPAEFLRAHKPPEKSWKVVKEVEPGLTVGGQPAARITFAGALDPNGRGATDYTAEFFAIRQGSRLFEISGTFPTTDEDAKNQFRSAMESVAFSNQ